MVSFEEIKQRVSQARERVALQKEKRREFKEAAEARRFEQQKQRLESATNRDFTTDSERLCWLQLARTPNIVPATHKKLIQRFGSAQSAIKAIPELPQSKRLNICPLAKAEDELEAHEIYGAQLLLSCDPFYPGALKSIHDAPPVLSLYGQTSYE